MEKVQIFYEYGDRLVPSDPKFRADDCPLEESFDNSDIVGSFEAVGIYCWSKCDNQNCPFREYCD
jgi:hypothetical protein